jgi:hypothetical protein
MKPYDDESGEMKKVTMGTKKVMIKTMIKVITATTELKITSDDQGRNDSDIYYEMIAGLYILISRRRGFL